MKLFDFFSREKEIEPENDLITKEVNFCIATNTQDNLSLFLKNGYKLNSTQINNIIFLPNIYQNNSGKINLIHILKNNSIEIKDIINRVLNSIYLNTVNDKYYDENKEIDIVKSVYSLGINILYDKDKEELIKIDNILVQIKEHLLDSSSTFKNNMINSLMELEKVFLNYYGKNNSHIKQYQNTLNIEMLPLNIQNTIKEIKELFLKIKPNLKNLEINKQFAINNLYEKRLPQVLSEYINISEGYRENIEDFRGNNGTKLLNDSLKLIQASLMDIEKSMAEENIKKMSITNTYLKNLQ